MFVIIYIVRLLTISLFLPMSGISTGFELVYWSILSISRKNVKRKRIPINLNYFSDSVRPMAESLLRSKEQTRQTQISQH